MRTFGDSLHGTNVNRKLAPLHRRRALWTSTVNAIQNYGDVRDPPADWTDGRATRYLVRRHRPSGARRARKGRSAPIPPRNRLQRPQNSRHRDLQSFPNRDCPAWVHPGPGGTAELVPLPSRPTLKWGEVMSDGREEREEREVRIEQEKQENREDRIDRDDEDESEPERVDS